MVRCLFPECMNYLSLFVEYALFIFYRFLLLINLSHFLVIIFKCIQLFIYFFLSTISQGMITLDFEAYSKFDIDCFIQINKRA